MADLPAVSVLYFADVFLSFVVFGPLTILYWRGTWALLDLYLYPEHPKTSAWVSTGVGVAILVLVWFLEGFLEKKLKRHTGVAHIIVSRLHTYIAGFGNVAHWRGVWNLWDEYTGKGLPSSAISMCIGIVGLCVARGFQNTYGPPIMVVRDVDPHFFRQTTRFRTNGKSSSRLLYCLDVLFTVVYIHSLVVFFWRGLWVLQDGLLFPDQAVPSAWASVVLGYAVAIVMGCLQFPAMLASWGLEKYPLVFKVVFEQVFYILCAISPVSIWRGIWNLCDEYILPSNQSASAWLTHGVGIGLLYLFFNASSVTVLGCMIDGALPKGRGCVYDIQLLTHHLVVDKLASFDTDEEQKENERKREEVQGGPATISNGDITSFDCGSNDSIFYGSSKTIVTISRTDISNKFEGFESL